MSKQQCKAAQCAGKCRESTVLPTLRETFDVIMNLVAGGALSEDHYEKIIEVATRFEEETNKRREFDAQVVTRLEAIIDIN